MKIVGVIPARYKSSRFEGKPLADICGKPMIWWVYQQAIKVKEFEAVYVATEDERIEKVCEELGISSVMTSNKHLTLTDRLYEFSQKFIADWYICINGDEPLISPDTIRSIIPKTKKNNQVYVLNTITSIKDPVEAVDPSNLKVINDCNGKGIYISRHPIPYPSGCMNFKYKKHVGVYAFNSKALEFYVTTARGEIETIENIDLLRFIENHRDVYFVEVDSDTLSVDTKKDLNQVIKIVNKKIRDGSIVLKK
jgi:3-deoxy-manno-octulosonate cytidylyltransferase (CMP-KDO synthetase)